MALHATQGTIAHNFRALHLMSYFVTHPTEAAGFLSLLYPSLNNFTGVSLAVTAHTCVLVKCM